MEIDTERSTGFESGDKFGLRNIVSSAKDLDRSKIRTIDFNGFAVEIYIGSPLRANRGVLSPILTDLYSRVFQRDMEESTKIVKGNLSHDSTIAALIRSKDEPDGPYRGFMTGCKYDLPIGEGEQSATLRVGYLSDRAFLHELRQHGLGTFLYQIFPLFYSVDERESLDMIFHRIGNPAAGWSAIKSGVFKYGYHPFGDGERPHPYTLNPLARDVAYALYPRIIRHSDAYFRDTGLSKGEYKQRDKEFVVVYEEKPGHIPTMNILRMMRRYGARLNLGDGFISGGPAKPTAVILAENPQLLRNPDYKPLAQAA